MTPAPSTPGWQNQIYENQTTHTNQFIHHPASTSEGASGNFIQSALILICTGTPLSLPTVSTLSTLPLSGIENRAILRQFHSVQFDFDFRSSTALSRSGALAFLVLCPSFITLVLSRLNICPISIQFLLLFSVQTSHLSTNILVFGLLDICPQFYFCFLSRLHICPKQILRSVFVSFIYLSTKLVS